MRNSDAAEIAARFVRLERDVASLSRARQVARSTVQIEGEAVPIPDALQAGVQAGAVAEEAQQAAADALAEAALAKTTADGKNRIIASPTEPVPVEDAPFTQGDLWYELDDEGRTVRIHVWDGSGWAPQNILANQILVPGSVGPVLIEDGAVSGPKLAFDAMFGKEIHGAYVEAPIIASSPNLGMGANVLADPDFQGAVDEHWVATGHTGETGFVQRDIQTWSDTWSSTSWTQGRIEACFTVKPLPVTAGSVLRDYHSKIVNPATRNINASGRNTSGLIGWEYDNGNTVQMPPLAVDAPVTTVLENSNTITLNAGETWSMLLEHAGLDSDTVVNVTDARAQLVDAVTGDLVWERVLEAPELANAVPVRAQFVAPATVAVKFRVRATYLAAGGGVHRYAATGSYHKGEGGITTLVTQWDRNLTNYPVDPGNPSESLTGVGLRPPVPPYGGSRTSAGDANTDYLWTNPEAPGYTAATAKAWHKGRTQWRLTRAVLGKVAPEKGYRIDQEQGFQLFNEAGAQTGRLDGASNFLAGRFATAESGQRLEMDAGYLRWYDQFGQLLRQEGPAKPLHVQVGTVVFDGSGGSNAPTRTIAFSGFSAPPAVVIGPQVSAGGAIVAAGALNITTMGATVRAGTATQSAFTGRYEFSWVAVGPAA